MPHCPEQGNCFFFETAVAAGEQATLRYVDVVTISVERLRVVVVGLTLDQQAHADENWPFSGH